MRAGALRHHIKLISFISSVDNFGGVIKEYYEVLHTRAEIKPGVASEAFESKQVVTVAPVDVFIRVPFVRVVGKMHLIFNGRVFDIAGVVNKNEKNVLMVLKCFEDTSPNNDKLNPNTPPGVNLKIGAVYDANTSTWQEATRQF